MVSVRYIATDVDRSLEFYRDRLGFKVEMHNPSTFAALVRDDLTLYLSAPGAGSGGTAGGFQNDPAVKYRNVTPPYFQLLSFSGQRPTGAVEYHPAFEATN